MPRQSSCFASLYDALGLVIFLLRTSTFRRTLPRPLAQFDEANLARIRSRLASHKRRLHREPDCALLVPLVTVRNEPALLFTRRPVSLRAHGGQVCFPGGRRDPEDATLENCALREFEEEVGVPRSRVELLGSFSHVMTLGSGHVVAPVLGFLGPYEELGIKASPAEVDAVYAARLSDLARPPPPAPPRRLTPRQADPARTDAPALLSPAGPVFRATATAVWGMTARLTWEMLDTVLRDEPR